MHTFNVVSAIAELGSTPIACNKHIPKQVVNPETGQLEDIMGFLVDGVLYVHPDRFEELKAQFGASNFSEVN